LRDHANLEMQNKVLEPSIVIISDYLIIIISANHRRLVARVTTLCKVATTLRKAVTTLCKVATTLCKAVTTLCKAATTLCKAATTLC
jgi:hypothetical protein